MPYILYTLGAHSASICHRQLSTFWGMGALARGARALCAYPAVSKLRFLVSSAARCAALDSFFRSSWQRCWMVNGKNFFSLVISNLQKELCRTLQNFALSRSAKVGCSIFAV